jgi:hypothetical protein
VTLDASFVLVVCGAAWVHPALGLVVGGAYLGLLRLMEWRLGADTPAVGADDQGGQP